MSGRVNRFVGFLQAGDLTDAVIDGENFCGDISYL